MNVYVEYVILDNFVLDTLLLWAAALTIKIPCKKWRIAIGGVIGAACAVVSVYLSGVWLYILKAGCLIAMCMSAVGFGKKLFWYILLTVTYTFVAGGAIVGLFNLFKIDYFDGGFYNMRIPLFVYVSAFGVTFFLCFAIVNFVRQTKKIAPHLIKIVVKLDKSYCLTGFCDSGNTLSYEGLPVCFVTKKFGGFSEYFAKQLLENRTVRLPVTTVAGTVEVNAIAATVSVGGNERATYLALPVEKCQTIYNVLLNSEFCGGDL